MLNDPMVLILMYFVLPVWLVAGFADWLCHRATHIESTTGAKESLIHLLSSPKSAFLCSRRCSWRLTPWSLP
jgi:hypothetical protein